MNRLAILSAAAGFALAPAAHAAAVSDFYKGRQISVVVAAGAGGSFGIRANLLSKHFAKHMGGAPVIVPQYMPGAGGRKAANFVYEAAAKDGTALGLVFANTPQAQLLQPKGAKYDAGKFHYLGSHSPVYIVSFVWHQAPATDIAGMKQKQVIMGATGLTSPSGVQPIFLNNMIGTRFKVVTGYSGIAGVLKAIEGGEVHGGTVDWDTILSTRPEWIRDRKAVPFVIFAAERLPALKDVPTPIDLATSDDDRKIARFMAVSGDIGHTYVAPPGVPMDRIAALRKAMAATFADADYKTAAEKANVPAEPVSGEKVESLVKEVMSLPAPLVKRAQALAGFKP